MGSHFIIQARFLHCHCSISHGKASKRQRCLWRRCSKVPGKKYYGVGIAFIRRGKITRRPWLSFLVGLEQKYFQNAVNNWVGRLLGCSLPLSPSHRDYSIGVVSELKCLGRGHRLVVWVLGELGSVGFKSHSNLWSGLVSGCSVFNCTTLCK